MSKTAIDMAARKFAESKDELISVAQKYPVKLPRFLLDRIEDGTYSLDAAKQYLPQAKELVDNISSGFDVCNEKEYLETPSLIQKYRNRCALIATHKCLVYCRFCFRRDFVGISGNAVSASQLKEAVQYIREHPQNRDVLISGGDPLALHNRDLIPLLTELSEIEHVKIIRIHTRALSSFPQRFDDELVRHLGDTNKCWVYNHMNHPDDLNHPEVIGTAKLLSAIGVPLLNQCVILGGVNDDPDTIKELMMLCYENKIIPYHLYLLDAVSGTDHFQIPIGRIQELFECLADLPGPAQPVLVKVDRENQKQRAVYNSSLDFKSFIRS